MSDVDEDIIPRTGPPAEEIDLSEETQDFRFLAAVSSDDAKIPKRGEKDFEPHATALQTNTLTASRQAMHNALSFQRVHHPKGYSAAIYHPGSNMAYAYSPKGPMFKTMGQVLSAEDDPLGNDERRGQRLWLLPEEVLYCVERGSLDVRWPASDGEDEDDGLAMSLQGAFAMFIGDEESHAGALTFERYSVYSGLKRMGYTIMRAASWTDCGPPPDANCYPQPQSRTWATGLFNFHHMWNKIFAGQRHDQSENQSTGPLLVPGLYRSYADIYRRLALINYHDPTTQTAPEIRDTPSATDPSISVTFDVWKPGSPTFRKRSPGAPDFRIAVINARETSVPTLQQLSDLLETTPYDPPKPGAQLNQKLKQGYKNVILAVVDQGVVSYLRIADAAFGRERLYERKGKGPGAKRGGGRGGRGGRGRGR